jgi:hypothetical protein
MPGKSVYINGSSLRKIWFNIVLCLGACFIFSHGAMAQMPFGAAPGPTELSLGKGVPTTGRFQVFVSPNIEGKTFMIDSDTGRIWMVKKNHATGDLYLDMLSVRGIHENEKGADKADESE